MSFRRGNKAPMRALSISARLGIKVVRSWKLFGLLGQVVLENRDNVLNTQRRNSVCFIGGASECDKCGVG